MTGPHSLELKMMIKTGVSLGLMLLVSAAVSQEHKPGTSSAAPLVVKVFEVKPVQRAPAILAPNAQTPASPLRLDDQVKMQVLEGLGTGTAAASGGDAENKSSLEHIVLSSQQPFIAGQAILTLTQPSTVHPETGIKFTDEIAASAAIKLMVQKGHSYLLDFLVRSSGSGSYTVETTGGRQEFEDKAGDREHVLLAISALNSGWTTVRIKHQGSDFYLYSVEATKVN